MKKITHTDRARTLRSLAGQREPLTGLDLLLARVLLKSPDLTALPSLSASDENNNCNALDTLTPAGRRR